MQLIESRPNSAVSSSWRWSRRRFRGWRSVPSRCRQRAERTAAPDRVELNRIEPYAAGIAALHVPVAAIVDYRRVAAALVQEIRGLGSDVITGCRVQSFARQNGLLRLATSRGTLLTRHVVNCAGLHTDRVALLAGAVPPVRIVRSAASITFCGQNVGI